MIASESCGGGILIHRLLLKANVSGAVGVAAFNFVYFRRACMH